MSDAMATPPLGESETQRNPTVYFIDDSATMREVIKIAFRRENINVITHGDAASALAQFEQHPPDVVITDVIMPEQDGYSVCSQIKQNPQYGKTPVILMSGVVNKSVADRAVAVQADELVRKPFQPQELITRVKNLLNPPSLPAPAERPLAMPSLSSLFAPPQAQAHAHATPTPAAPIPVAPRVEPRTGESAWPRAVVDAFVHQNAHSASSPATSLAAAAPRPPATAHDIQKLRTEISRLELLIKKLQTELQIERQYNQALELHVRTLTEVE
jgi:CheY-like chemotaxis protein